LNFIWAFLIISGVLFAAINGKMAECTQAVIDAAKGSVELAIGLIGIMAFWLGLMRLAEEAGLVRFLSRILKPILRPLFPSIPSDDPALGAMVANFAANILGLGNSATALGLKAMIELERLNPHKKTASNAMCTFLAINTSSLTLIPATVIAIRASAGSANPAEVIGVIILVTSISTVVAITAVKILEKLPAFKIKPEEDQNG